MSTDRVGGSGIVRRHKATHATGGTDALTPADIGAVPNSLFDAKGDLIVASADNTPDNLAVGTDGQVLTADSNETLGVKWADAAGGGNGLLAVLTYTSSGTFDKGDYPGLAAIYAEVQGGGGGSGYKGNTTYRAGGAGGGGGYAAKLITDIASLSASETVTVGSGGSGGIASTSTSATAGGNSTFAGLTGSGGGAGINTAGAGNPHTNGGAASGGDLNIPGSPGQRPFGGSGAGFMIAGMSGASYLSNAVPGQSGDGLPGLVYGGGASGTPSTLATTYDGYAGGAGVVILRLYGS